MINSTVSAIGTVEVALANGFGSDFAMQGPGDPNPGDFVLLIDTQRDAPATNQRLQVKLRMNPRGVTSTGVPTQPSDIFNLDDGVGLDSLVDAMLDDALSDEITSRIKHVWSNDPGVASSPGTTVIVTYYNQNEADISIEYDAVSGAVGAIPAVSLSALNTAGG